MYCVVGFDTYAFRTAPFSGYMKIRSFMQKIIYNKGNG